MVIRLRVACWPDAGSCRLQLRMREGRQKRSNPYLGRLIYSLRRSRGATGRYQGPTGAAAVAARVPRRPMDGSDAGPGKGKGLTLYPPYPFPGRGRICESVPTAPRGPSDRSRTCVPMVWIDTKYTNTHRPTARRRTRPLGLRGAPRGTVGDVPTAEGGEVAVTARCMRARACGELRLTRQYEHDILSLM